MEEIRDKNKLISKKYFLQENIKYTLSLVNKERNNKRSHMHHLQYRCLLHITAEFPSEIICKLSPKDRFNADDVNASVLLFPSRYTCFTFITQLRFNIFWMSRATALLYLSDGLLCNNWIVSMLSSFSTTLLDPRRHACFMPCTPKLSFSHGISPSVVHKSNPSRFIIIYTIV